MVEKKDPIEELFEGKSASEENEPKTFKEKAWLFVVDVGVNLVILVILVWVIRAFFVTPFRVFGPSMCNTINYIEDECAFGFGEYLIIDKFSYQNFFGWQVSLPKRGDIIVFHPPEDSGHSQDSYIKRVIGVPGDTLILQDGEVYIKNEANSEPVKLLEPYLSERNKGNTQKQHLTLSEFKVPEGKYFVMGDNRLSSTDSRSCFKPRFSAKCEEADAFLSLDKIQGKAWFSLWPVSKIRGIEHAEYPELK